MPFQQSKATTRALSLIGKPRRGGGVHTAYSAAKLCGISLSTIYRALKRHKGETCSMTSTATEKSAATPSTKA